MSNYEKIVTIVKQSLSGVLPCYMVGSIAEHIADALVAEGISMREDEGK